MALDDLFPKKIFLVSDLHFDHTNIITYCNRPFADIEEMNQALVTNWNNTVQDDVVYFLGDLAFGKHARRTSYWLQQLSGDIHFIRGNHDHHVPQSQSHDFLRYGGYEFLLVHEPAHPPMMGDRWIIHGHKHNNDLRNYPFINGERRTINVSVEVIDYKPVCLDEILSLDLGTIVRMDTITSTPLRRGRR